MNTDKKPYFLPLKKEFYLKVKPGEQDCEIRPANYRGWNGKNIYTGRKIQFSSGYGNYDRHCREVTLIKEGGAGFAFMGIPQWHIDAVEQIYGKRDRGLVAFVR